MGNVQKKLENNWYDSKVANNADDVNTVMLTGFFHAYGPVNNFFD